LLTSSNGSEVAGETITESFGRGGNKRN